MAINEEIARLTGTLAFKVDLTGLHTFEAKLSSIETKMRAFVALTNQRFNIKVQIDSAGLKASLDKAANSKLRFNNVNVATEALARVVGSVTERFARAPVILKNIKLDLSSVLAQRAAMRSQLEAVSVGVGVVLRMNNATTKLRAWKKMTEEKFKLYLNADISGAKLYRNAAKTLRDVGARLGTFTVTSPKIKLTVDRAALRAEIASVLEQIKREVKIKIDLTGHVTGNPRGGSGGHAGAAFGGGLVGGGMGFMRGLVPGLGAAYAVSKLNEINQQMKGQDLALTAVTGSKENGQAAKKRLRVMADDIGFNARELTPAFTKMIASGEASGFGQAKSEKVFKSMAEYGRVMGLSSEDMKGSMRAVEQMMNKGQIMSEELKGQLAERFPAAIALFAKSQNMSSAELFKAMEKGLIKSDALEAFAETLAKEARKGGALDAAKQSTAAQQQRMGNNISDSIQSFSDGGFDSASATFFKVVADGLAKSQPLIKGLGMAFEILIMPITSTIKLLGDLALAWPDMAKSMGMTTGQFTTLAAAAGIFLTPLGGIVIGLGAMLVVLQDLVSYGKGEDSVFGRWVKDTPLAQESVDKLKNAWGEFKFTLERTTESVTTLLEKMGFLSKSTSEVAFSPTFISTLDKLSIILTALSSAIEAVGNLTSGNMSGIGDSLSKMKSSLEDYAQTMLFDAAGTMLRGAARNIIDARPVYKDVSPQPEVSPYGARYSSDAGPTNVTIPGMVIQFTGAIDSDLANNLLGSEIAKHVQERLSLANVNLTESQ
ncbi:putative tape measure protein [Pseudomonas phage phiK7A1]|uniref:Putative tape measure protein n=1 Tax=Pseudomonas phage phiK7A1 TaxID=2759194 RepID=A0A7H0XFS8_9CAUD|nr:putative tape measure protein [Pseudomonas phage phiK7A1]